MIVPASVADVATLVTTAMTVLDKTKANQPTGKN